MDERSPVSPPAPAHVPPGWYPDPWQGGTWRWFDGVSWTAHVSPPPTGHASPTGDESPGMARAVWPSIGWMLVSLVVSVVVVLPVIVAAEAFGIDAERLDAPITVVFYLGLFGAFWMAARRISDRYGTGDLRRDFGTRRFRPADLGWGVLAGIGALVLQIVLAAMIPQPGDDTYREAMLGADPSTAMYVVIFLASVIGAPVFEELLFRGPIMRSLLARAGVLPGLVLQAVVFAGYHVVGVWSLARLWYVVPLFASGLVFGVAAQRTGRLATAQIAHGVMNACAFAALAAS